MSYTLAEVLDLAPKTNEPIRYRGLILRKKRSCNEYIVAKDGDRFAEVSVNDFVDVEDFRTYLDRLSPQTHKAATVTPVADGGTVTAVSPDSARSFGVSVASSKVFLVMGVLLVLSAGSSMATSLFGPAWLVQLVGGLLILGVGVRRRGGGS